MKIFKNCGLIFVFATLGASLQGCSPTVAKLKASDRPSASSGEQASDLPRIQMLTVPDLKIQAGQTLTIGTNIQAVPMKQNYLVFLHFVDAAGNLGFSTQYEPVVPTSQWKGLISETRKVVVPAQVSGGTYAVRMGLMENGSPSANRVKLETGLGVTADNELRYEVGSLKVEAQPVPLPPPAPPTCPAPKGQDGSQFHMVFRDEFESTELNSGTWNETLWYEASNPTRNFSVEDGRLKIWPQKDESEEFFNRTIDTDGKYQQTYGFFEIEAKLPVGKGLWPAFWLFNHIDDRRPEIAVMDAFSGGGVQEGRSDVNFHPTAFASSVWITTDQLHDRQVLKTSDLSSAFHTYAMKWETDRLSFHFDGKEFWSTTASFSDPMYLMLNLWFGKASGEPDDSTPRGKSNSLEVKYIRAWQFGPGNGISCL